MAAAAQIIDLNSAGKLHLNIERLEKILMRSEFKNKPVCVVSITGVFRQGKSFLMNLLIPYLTMMTGNSVQVDKWLRENREFERSFAWRSGAKPHTNGIYMYHKVFLVKNSMGEEIALVLLDTQGTFDNRTSVNSCSKIFALSTLISSLQIYNLKDNIKQYDLEHLEYFASHGNRIRGDTNEAQRTPFQNLLFLIRDWMNPSEYRYGLEGGQDFLDEQLNEQGDEDESLVSLKKNVKKLFKRIECFLMPFPGTSVGAFNGDLSRLDPKFVDFVENFGSNILNPNNLPIKTINDQKITVSELFQIIQKYCAKFESEDAPQLMSMIEVAAEVQFNHAVEASTVLYHSIMNIIDNKSNDEALSDEDLHNRNKTAQDQAIKAFEENNTIKREHIKAKHKEILKNKLNEAFKLCKDMNELRFADQQIKKAQEKQTVKIYYKRLVSEAMEFYDKTMEFLKNKNQKALSDDEFQAKHAEAGKNVGDHFQKGSKTDHAEIHNKYVEKLNQKLKMKHEDYFNVNLIKRKMEATEEKLRKEAEAEFNYNSALEEALSVYDGMMDVVEAHEGLLLERKHKSAESKAKRHFNATKNPETQVIWEKYALKLEKELAAKFREYENLNSKLEMSRQLAEASKTVENLRKEVAENRIVARQQPVPQQQQQVQKKSQGSSILKTFIEVASVPIIGLLTAWLTNKNKSKSTKQPQIVEVDYDYCVPQYCSTQYNPC